MAVVNIPAPSKKDNEALSKLGPGNYQLVYDKETKKWRVVKRGDLKPNQVSYNDWSSGTKTYEEKGPGQGGAGPKYVGKTDDQVAVDNAVQTATITMGPSGPVVNFTVPNPKDPKGDPVTYQSYLYVDGRGKVSLSPDDARAGEMFSSFRLKAPSNTKAAVRYNDLLKFKKLDKKYESIIEGDKLFIVNLKQNPYNLETIGIPNASVPPEIEEFVKAYIDVDEIFESLLGNKLKNLYGDLNWEFPSLNPNIKKFFAF